MASRILSDKNATARAANDYLLVGAVVLIVALWVYTRLESKPNAQPGVYSPGAHGGTIVSFANDRYHAEAVAEQGGLLRVFALGRDETEVADVEEQSLTAYVDFGQRELTAVTLSPDPQPEDAAGRTSQFVGQLPASLPAGPMQVTIPQLTIGQARYRLAFRWDEPHLSAMPSKVQDDQERQLYLVAGGDYTESDIAANGRRTASQKFADFKPRHDARPKPGEAICPITRTKANPQCDWVVGGRRYLFCCPPCIDEFVTLAKQRPGELQPPDHYVR